MEMRLDSSNDSGNDSGSRSDGSFCVSCSVKNLTHSLNVSSVFIKGMPVLKISKLKAPLCRHRFIWNCPRYISSKNWNQNRNWGEKNQINQKELNQKNLKDFGIQKKEFPKMFEKVFLRLKKYSCEAVFVLLMIGAVFFIRCSEKDWKSVLKEENTYIHDMFVQTCNGNGFNSLDEWKNVCCEKFKLDYITWSKAPEYVLNAENEYADTEESENYSQNGVLYFGRWHGKNGYGEVYARMLE
ncbi:MAG: hypothetical protein K6A43_09550 [Treponema sp.]|nr:hypothetical protein [Treponema sp.]